MSVASDLPTPRRVHVGRALLTALAAVLYALGWVAAMVWLPFVWCALAVKVGWVEARAREGD